MSEVKVAAFQFDLEAGDVEANLERVEAALHAAATEGVQLVDLPEMWPTSFVDVGPRAAELVEVSEKAVDRVRELSGELGLTVFGSAFADAGARERLYNRWHLLDHGRRLDSYDKVHLFSPTAEPFHFVAGEAAPEAQETKAGLVSGGICYDLRFPELFRRAFRQRTQFIGLPAQWPDARAGHWVALAVARAIENQCFVIAVNRTGRVVLGRRKHELRFPGNSLIVDPTGEVLAEGTGDDGLVIAACDLEEARHFRVRVPIEKDERTELHGDWTAP